MTVKQKLVTKLTAMGFTLREIEILIGMPASRNGSGARQELKFAQGKRRVGGKYE